LVMLNTVAFVIASVLAVFAVFAVAVMVLQ
jgi:hypothetical protein